MSAKTRGGSKANKEVRALISLASDTPGWRVEEKYARALIYAPNGEVLNIGFDADPSDVRQVTTKAAKLGLTADARESVAVRPTGSKPYEQMSLEERAVRVWMAARDYAKGNNCAEEMHDGALYYLITDKSLAFFVTTVFPQVVDYEQGPRPSDEGQRPILDHLRCQQMLMRKGHQRKPHEGEAVLVSGSSNPRAEKQDARVRPVKKTASKAASPVSRRQVQSTHDVPEVGRYIQQKGERLAALVEKYDDRSKAVTLHYIDGRQKNLLINLVGAWEYTEVECPRVGTLLRPKPNGKRVYRLVEFGQDFDVILECVFSPGGSDLGVRVTKTWGELEPGYFTVTDVEFVELQIPVIREAVAAIKPVEEPKMPEPIQPVVATPTDDRRDAVQAALDLLREEVESAMTEGDPRAIAELTQARREMAIKDADIEHQTRRAERAEQTLADIRHAVETMAPGEAYQAVIKIVPPAMA